MTRYVNGASPFLTAAQLAEDHTVTISDVVSELGAPQTAAILRAMADLIEAGAIAPQKLH